jgi:hypothetical protein
MTIKFKKFQHNKEIVFKALKIRETEFINNASDKVYAKEEFFRIFNNEFTDKQKKLQISYSFFLDIEEKKRLDKNFDESNAYNKLSDLEIINYSTILGYKKYFDECHITEIEKPNPLSPKKKFNFNSSITWQGYTGSKTNYTMFVKLIYAMIESKYFSLSEGVNKYDAIEQIAEIFEVQLSKHWKSSLSNTIEKEMKNPPIFKDLENAYEKYTKKLKDNKNK